MSNKQLTIEEKIEKIESSENFADLKTGWFPQSASTSYYFVSYCHKDYKKVFVDILEMQRYDSEVAVWYDRELNIGHDWEKEAKTHIYDFDCLGVIFYVSENSVESPAIFKEMQMAMDAGKPFIPIVLPVEQIRSRAGEYLSGAELLEILYPRLSEDDEKYKLYHEMFGANILYFKSSDSPQEKTERMKKSFTRQPLLVLNEESKNVGSLHVAVIAVNNINVIEITENDFRFVNEDNHRIRINMIGACAFANCRQLERIELPQTVRILASYAFYNCMTLKEVSLPEDTILQYIEEKAFANCRNLTNITLPKNLLLLGKEAFLGCESLTNIVIPSYIESIEPSLFMGCSSLTRVELPNSLTSIGDRAFRGCSSLTSIEIPHGVEAIGMSAFEDCSSLTSIKFAGTIEEWNNIHKELTRITILFDTKETYAISYELVLGIDHEVTVVCTDGEITIGKQIK